MPAPHEIIAAPFTVWVAPTGEAFPTIAATVAGNWFKLGTSGEKNYDDAGVSVQHPQTKSQFRGAGSTVTRKTFRTEEDFIIGFTLVDLSPEQYAKILDDAAVTTVVGPPGHKSFELARGLSVSQYALFARGQSTVNNALNAQYEISAVESEGSPNPVFTKGNPAGLAVEFRAVDHDGNGNIGTLRIQTTA
ncbi:MAG: hypothetical protein ACRDNE_00645 [Gaiellaceae bacterium]